MSLIATSKNSVIQFRSALTGTLTLGGFSNENILAIPDVDIVKSTIGNDGIINRSVVAKKVEGSFSFFSNSDSLQNIYTIQQAVYLTGLPISGILSVLFPTSGKVYTYLDFSFLSGAKGIEAADEQKPVTIKWDAQLPNYAGLGAVVGQAITLI